MRTQKNILPEALAWHRRYSIVILLLLLMVAVAGTLYWRGVGRAAVTMPVNPNTNETTRNVLRYLQSLPEKTSKKHISGQNNLWNGTSATTIYNATGEYLGLHGAGVDAPRSSLKAQWEAGGLVALSDHPNNPVTNGSAHDKNIDIAKMLTPSTTEWNAWHQQMDKLANYLGALQSDGVPVLWRPYHEANCASFWWSYAESGNVTMTPDRYKAMYQEMYNYFTHTKKLNNLLWVWSPHQCDLPRNQDWKGRNIAYPGDAYVDIVGLDDYLGDNHTSSQIQSIKNFAESHPTKVFALTEFGGDRGWNMTASSGLLGVLQAIPQTTFYMLWHNGHEHNLQTNWQALLQHSLIANRDEVAAGLSAVSQPVLKPDLVVTDVSWSPALPKLGDEITFSATIKNQGQGATPATVIHGVSFWINGTKLTWSDTHTTALASGQSITLTANGGITGNTWAATAGNHEVEAFVDDLNRIPDEANESNNKLSRNLSIAHVSKPGDINEDGAVNASDLNAVLSNYGKANTSKSQGDANDDSIVNGLDLSLVIAHYGT